ncbi:unnamed protein product [Calypogeia fissa]
MQKSKRRGCVFGCPVGYCHLPKLGQYLNEGFWFPAIASLALRQNDCSLGLWRRTLLARVLCYLRGRIVCGRVFGVDDWSRPCIHVWRSARNSINRLLGHKFEVWKQRKLVM